MSFKNILLIKSPTIIWEKDQHSISTSVTEEVPEPLGLAYLGAVLRNNGYNLFNAFLLYKNIPIPEVPTVIKLLIFASGTIIIVCCSMI